MVDNVVQFEVNWLCDLIDLLINLLHKFLILTFIFKVSLPSDCLYLLHVRGSSVLHLIQLQDHVAQVGHGVAVVDLVDTELTQHSLVLVSLTLLELVNHFHAVEDSQKLNQLAELLHLLGIGILILLQIIPLGLELLDTPCGIGSV